MVIYEPIAYWQFLHPLATILGPGEQPGRGEKERHQCSTNSVVPLLLFCIQS